MTTPCLPPRHAEAGSTLIEVMVALTVLAVGLMGLAQVILLGMAHASVSQAHLVAREKAREAVESVHTARDTRTITWAQIRNTSAGTGVFVVGAQPLRQPGPDGLVNTADDPDALEVIGPGPDGLPGTADDERAVGFQRELIIEDVPASPALRRLTVVITYPARSLTPPPYRLVTFVSSFS
jgi:prepilin-type N-terminal cleavage/methylation domain-containing protein